MKISKCVPQKISKLMLGLFVLASALALFILGITLIPVIGIILSLPTFAMAIKIFKLH